jgi:hypothetical protein
MIYFRIGKWGRDECCFDKRVPVQRKWDAWKNAYRTGIIKSYVYNCYFSGQQRSRMLGTLFKDERCQQLRACGILRKM